MSGQTLNGSFYKPKMTFNVHFLETFLDKYYKTLIIFNLIQGITLFLIATEIKQIHLLYLSYN